MSKDIRYYFGSSNTNQQIIDASANQLASTTNENSLKLEAFTDGSAINNGKKNVLSGIGVFYPDTSLNLVNKAVNCNKFIQKNPKYSIKPTNNVAELLAILFAIEDLLPIAFAKDPIPSLVIYSDSEYSINCITKWADGWKKAGWKKKGNAEIKNLEIIKIIYSYYKKNKIRFVHVNSHQAEPYPKGSERWQLWYGNDMADKLAVQGAKSF